VKLGDEGCLNTFSHPRLVFIIVLAFAQSMPRKKSTGFCLFHNGNHYFIPMGKMDQSPKGDLVWGFGEKGEHITFHNSRQIHYKDENGNYILLNKPGSLKLLIESYKPIFEPFQEINTTERKFIINLLKHNQPAFRTNGCFDPNCKNRAGEALDFNEIMNLTVEYLNNNNKIFFQIEGKIEKTYDPQEIEDENNDDDIWNTIMIKSKLEKIPECKICIGKNKIQYKKRKFIWIKCPRCGGLGLDLEKLEKYKVE